MEYMEYLEPFRMWVASTKLSLFMRNSGYFWGLFESIHYLGLCLLIGTIGIWDLRLMGVAKRIPPASLHRLIPWGILGYSVNVITGICFFAGYPDQYMYNSAFQFKMVFMTLAGINVMVFYATMFRKVKALGPGDDVPRAARLIGGFSLFLWLAVLTCGRLLTFYRPPFFLRP